MKKYILFIILFIIPIFCSTSYADVIKVKTPLNMHAIVDGCPATPTDWVYECSITTWFQSIWKSIGQIIKYFTFITGLAWVLYIIYNWIKLSMAWVNQEYEKEAKDDIKKTLLWLVLLLLSWMILNFIAPWIYK